MRVPRSVAQMLRKPGTLEVESIDRMYLHVYIPRRQHECGVAGFFRVHRSHPFASSARMEPISKAFIRALEAVAAQAGVPHGEAEAPDHRPVLPVDRAGHAPSIRLAPVAETRESSHEGRGDTSPRTPVMQEIGKVFA